MRQVRRKCHSKEEQQDPSGRDIRDACERIQSGWSDNERRKRAGLTRLEPWIPPLVPSYQLGADMEVELDN